MYFYDYYYAGFGYDLSYFKKFNIVNGSVEDELIAIKFDEKEADYFFKAAYESYDSSHLFSYDDFLKRNFVLGESGYFYKYVGGKFIKTGDKGFFRFWRSYLFLKFRQKHVLKNRKFMEKSDEKYSQTTVVKNKTVFPYESYVYCNKENDIAFRFRLKRASKPDQPLVIYMSGAGCLGCDNFKQMFEYHCSVDKKLKNYDFSVLIPQAPFGANMGSDLFGRYVESVRALIDSVFEEVKADRKKLYLFGTSFGGLCTWEMVYRSPEYFACGLPVMGGLIVWKNKEDIDFERFLSTPLWVAHSADDDNVKIDSDDYCVEELKKIGADVRYTRWDKFGHKMSSKFYKREPWEEWMFKQVKK